MSKIYLAKIRKKKQFSKQVSLNNPKPIKDGGVNDYHEGVLIWYDAKTKKYSQILNMHITEIPEDQQKNDFVENLIIDLDEDAGMVKEIKS